MPAERIYEVLEQSPYIARTLQMPHIEPLDCRLSSVGSLGRDDFGLKVEVRSDKHGSLEGHVPRTGNLYHQRPDRYLLVSKELNGLLSLIDEGLGGIEPGKKIARDTIYMARAKRCAEEAGAELEPWIANESYVFPEAIGVDFEQSSDDEVKLLPTAEGVDSDTLQRHLQQSVGSRNILTEVEGERRNRMILSQSDREKLTHFAGPGSVLKGADIPRFLETPEAFLPEGIDLSEYSERVKGIKIRIYNSHPYVTVNKQKYDWFPKTGVELERAAGEATAPSTPDAPAPPKLDPGTYEKLAKESVESDTPYVQHDGAWIRIDPREARSFIDARDLERQYNPSPGSGLPKGAVLEIFQNLEAIEVRGGAPEEDEQEKTAVEILPEIQEYPVPECLLAKLMPHQEFGFNWLMTLNNRCKGGLLADDMGLGKTLQAIALLAARKEAQTVSPSVIVVRKSLIENWCREIHRFCPSLRVFPFMGGRMPPNEFLEQYDATVMSYESLRRNMVQLGKIDWKAILCDEAQDIKNPTTGRTDAAKAMKAETRVALTGTPVENGLSELWCIMDFVQPPILGSLKEFRKEYETPIVRADSQAARDEASGRLLDRIVDHYLRRKKEQILKDLPPKEIHRVETQLSDRQVETYQQLLQQGRAGGRGAMLAVLQQLLLLCAYPWAGMPPEAMGCDEKATRECPKLATLFEVLDEVQAQQEKALIFANRKDVHRFLQSAVRHRFGIWPSIINGDVHSGRQAVIDHFNETEGFNVLILSQKVGGAGLNIVSANHVIHYMRPWNPAVENQATDRTHRIGQKKIVHVYYPIAVTEGFRTAEEVLDQLLGDKGQLATDVLVPSSELRVKEKELMDRVFGGEEGGGGPVSGPSESV